MGRSTTADVVPFVAHYVFEFSGNYEDNEYFKLAEPECWAEEYGSEEFLDPNKPITLRGWNCTQDKYVGKKKRGVWGWEWVRASDGVSVVLVNESEYSNVGDCAIAVVADEKTHIEAFLEDFKDLIGYKSPTIESDDAVTITC